MTLLTKHRKTGILHCGIYADITLLSLTDGLASKCILLSIGHIQASAVEVYAESVFLLLLLWWIVCLFLPAVLLLGACLSSSLSECRRIVAMCIF